MPDYDITPDGQPTPKIRLYENALARIPRDQQNEAEAPAMEVGVDPVSEPSGVAAASVTLRGIWLGTDASTLADRLRTILKDASITAVDVQAVDSSGTAVSSPLNGTYTLAGESRVEQPAPTDDRAWTYEIRLSET